MLYWSIGVTKTNCAGISSGGYCISKAPGISKRYCSIRRGSRCRLKQKSLAVVLEPEGRTNTQSGSGLYLSYNPDRREPWVLERGVVSALKRQQQQGFSPKFCKPLFFYSKVFVFSEKTSSTSSVALICSCGVSSL